MSEKTTITPDAQVSAIFAMTEYGGFGFQGRLPWPRLKGDLPRFKAMTLGKPVIMGMSTFKGLGKPLPDRPNIVVTSSVSDLMKSDTEADEELLKSAYFVASVDQAIDFAKTFESDKIFVIGGAILLRGALPYCSTVELTIVADEHNELPCDVHMSMAWMSADWNIEVLEEVRNEQGVLTHVYNRLTRRAPTTA